MLLECFQPKQNLNILTLHLYTYGTQALYGHYPNIKGHQSLTLRLGHGVLPRHGHGPKPGCQEAEAYSILEAEALTLFKLEAEALVTKPKPSYL